VGRRVGVRGSAGFLSAAGSRVPRPGAIVIAVVATVLVTTACREPTKLDARRLERELPAAVLSDHPELVTDVSCPRPIERAAGTIVECDASISGTAVVLTVTQTDDKGAVGVALDRTLLDVDKLAAQIAARLTQDVGVATTVVCAGPVVRVLTVGDAISCTATDPSNRSRTFVATITDQTGAFDVKLV
jgi:Domain of unknown function (DUF4333)